MAVARISYGGNLGWVRVIDIFMVKVKVKNKVRR